LKIFANNSISFLLLSIETRYFRIDSGKRADFL